MASSSPAEDSPEAVPEKPPDRRVRGLDFLRSSVAPVTPEPLVTAAVFNNEEIPSSSKNPQPAPNPAPAPAPFTLPPAIASSSKGPQPPPAPFTLPPAIPSSSKGPQPPRNPAPPPAPFTLPPAIPSSSTAPPSAVGSSGCNDAAPASEGRTAKKARTVVLRGKFQQSTLTFGGVRVAPPSAPEDSEPEPEEPEEIPVRADTNSPILSKAEVDVTEVSKTVESITGDLDHRYLDKKADFGGSGNGWLPKFLALYGKKSDRKCHDWLTGCAALFKNKLPGFDHKKASQELATWCPIMESHHEDESFAQGLANFMGSGDAKSVLFPSDDRKRKEKELEEEEEEPREPAGEELAESDDDRDDNPEMDQEIEQSPPQDYLEEDDNPFLSDGEEGDEMYDIDQPTK
ncbi:unnamed protein product [Closterium sp. NIES-64]|nr:unnamed protein product [Closterium sp. NIES-64]